jgi:diguanylate cyclase (GGDEF)-like protein/PAS domain S-box-containing protein
METLTNVYILLLVQTAVVNLIIFLYSLFNRGVRFGRLFGLWNLVPFLWTFSNLLGATSPNYEQARFFLVNVRYSVIVLFPPLTLLFARFYGGFIQRVSWRTIALLYALPLTAVFFLFSPWQSLVLTDPIIENLGGFWFYFGETPQPVFWVVSMYGLGNLGLAVFLLVQQIWKGFAQYRMMRLILIAGTLAPILGGFVNTFSPAEFPFPDVGAIAFIIFGPAWAWAVFRGNTTDVAPIFRESLIENMDDGVFVIDLNDTIVEVNQAGAGMLARQREALVGQPLGEVFKAQRTLLREYQAQEELDMEIKVNRRGDFLYFDLKLSMINDASGEKVGRMMVMRDITRRKVDESLLATLVEESERRAQESEVLRVASAVVTSTLDMQETIQLVLDQLRKVVPYTSASVQLLQDGYLVIVGGRGFKDDVEIVGTRFSTNRGRESGPELHVFLSREVQIFPDAQKVFPDFRKPPHDHIHGWMGVLLQWHDQLIGVVTIDSSEVDAFGEDDARVALAFADQIAMAISNARLFEQVRSLAEKDPLTGLYNRRHFFELFSGSYNALREAEGCLTVLMLDLDLFKRINDHYGHTIGDQVLIGLAEYLREKLREEDIVARFGGEEFIILLPASDEDRARRIANRLRTDIENNPFPTERGGISVTVSIGVCTHDFATDAFLSIDEIVDRADLALLQAKQGGRNQVREYAA